MEKGVPLEAIPSWGSTFAAESLSETTSAEEGTDNDSENTPSPFPTVSEYSEKIKLWSGIPWKVAVDAVVNSTSETFETSEVFRGETIHVAAGPLLIQACRQLKCCRTSQACVTEGFNLSAKRIIHTVGPRYAAKYHTAAENALCHCIWSCLEALVEENFRSIAIGCIYTQAKGFPREVGAHVTARTIRRYLECHSGTVDAIVLCISEASDLDIYEQVLPLYFPRTKEEERSVLSKIPENVGNARGESLMEHRDIRISEMPEVKAEEADAMPQAVPGRSQAVANKTPKPKDTNKVVSWSSDFTQMTDSPDSRRSGENEGSSWKVSDIFGGFFSNMAISSNTGGNKAAADKEAPSADESSNHDQYHEQMLKMALGHNTDDVHMMRIFSKCLDADGDPVLVITGVHFLVKAVDPERFVLYFVKELETMCSGTYSVILLDTDTGPSNWPGFAFIRQVHSALGESHRTHLKAFYALHPTFRLKSAAFFLQVAEPNVWGKLKYLENLEELYAVVPTKNIRIPEHVLQCESSSVEPSNDSEPINQSITSNNGDL